MSSCIFPGSFDPLTCGHMDLITRAASVFDTVTVTVMINRTKTGCIPFEERIKLIRKACFHLPNVKTDMWNGLLADYMRAHSGSVIIRGVRNLQEYEQEINAAAINRRLLPGLETLLIPSSNDLADISSSAVKEIASFGGDYSAFVPECIRKELQKWLMPGK